MRRQISGMLGVAVLLAACAQRPENVQARYISPVGYQAWSCEQLAEERERTFREVTRIGDLQRENANADAAMLTVGVVLLWPVLFGLAATTDRREELGKVKGEYEAVEAAMRGKACAVTPLTPPAQPAAPAPNT